MMQLCTLDFETFYGDKYSLKSLSYTEYVRHEKFAVMCCTIGLNGEPCKSYFGQALQDKLDSIDWENTALIGHNVAFDALILHEHYNIHPAKYYCTKNMATHIFQSSIKSVSLDYLAERVLGKKKLSQHLIAVKNRYWDDLTAEEQANLMLYADNDGDLTYELFVAMKPHISEDELELISLNNRLFCNPVLKMNRQLVLEELHSVESNRKAILKAAGYAQGVFASTAKFAELLEKKGYKVPLKHSEKQNRAIPAVAKDDLEWVCMKEEMADDAQFMALAAAREECASSIHITRPKRFLDLTEGDRKVCVYYNYWGAKTGRFSGGNKTNFQNLERKSRLRYAIEAPDGYELCVADLSQIEVRMNAWFCEEFDLLEAFKNKRDIYSEFASDIYGMPVNRKNGDPEHEIKGFVGKVGILGLGYQMGEHRFWKTLRLGLMGPPVTLSDGEAAKTVQTYRGRYKKIAAMWGWLQSVLLRMMDKNCHVEYKGFTFKYNRVHLPNGTVLRYPQLHLTRDEEIMYWNGNFFTKIYGGLFLENLIQAASRIVMTDGILRIDPKYPVVMHTHDECVCITKEGEGESTLQSMIHDMTTPPKWCPDIPLAAEGGFAKNYSK